MFPLQRPFYHPFQNMSLGFSITANEPSNAQVEFKMDDINLYYQPVQEPIAGTMFFFNKLTSILIGCFIHSKILKLMGKESSSIIDNVTKFYLWNQIVVYSTGLLFVTITDFIHPAGEIIGYRFCTFGWIIIAFGGYSTIFFSFIVALMRYFFVLHNAKVEEFGKEKMKKIFIFLFISIPIFCVLMESFEEFSLFSYINKCYGKDHKVFLIETSTLNVLKHKFLSFENYEEADSFETLIDIMKRICKFIRQCLIILMGCNVSEAIIYYKVLTYMNR